MNQFFAFFILVVSVALVSLALPRFRAAFNNIPVDTAVERLNRKQELAMEKIPHLIETGKESIDLFDNAGYWADISDLKLHQSINEEISWCGLRMMFVNNEVEQVERVQGFQSEFESRKQECVVLIVNSTSNPDKWTIAGFNDEGEFNSLSIVDPDNDLAVELKKGPANESKIVELVTAEIGRTDISSNLRQELLLAEQYIQQSLSRSPVNSYLWYKLALVSFLQQDANTVIANSLLMSIMTGPYETGIMLDRLRLSFMVFQEFKGDDKDVLISQVILAWNAAPKDFLKNVAYDRKNRILLVLLLKENYPQVLEDMVLSFENTG